MNKIDELIQEFCPDGVEFKSVEAVSSLKRGTSITKKHIQDGDVPVIAGGQKPAYYHNQSNRSGETIVIAGSGAYAGFITFWDIPIFVSDAFSVVANESLALPKYIYYFLKSKQSLIHDMQRGGGVPHVYAKDVAPLRMPVPPLGVQKEIVNILDKFTQLEAGLSAELDARRRQYEYYKNTLLKPSEEVTWQTIGEVCEVGDGNHSSSYPKASEMVDQGIPFIRGTNIVDGTILGKDMKYISEEKHLKLKKGHLRANDVLVTNRGEVGKIAIVPEQFANSNLNSQIAWLRADNKILLPKYLFFIMNANFIQNKIIGEGGALKQLTIKNLKLLKIPVPSINKQEEIVNVLDNFDTLTNDKMVGIPAEIDARRKQYEYYRTKLLTFQELPV